MQRAPIPSLFVAATIALLGGCATAQRPSASPELVRAALGAQYSMAIEEAFDRYEREVAYAAQLDFESEAELEAVRASLSEARFDFNLRLALNRRGLTVRSLAAYAMENPEFFHAEQSRHWGRLARVRETLANLKVRSGPGQLALFDRLVDKSEIAR